MWNLVQLSKILERVKEVRGQYSPPLICEIQDQLDYVTDESQIWTQTQVCCIPVLRALKNGDVAKLWAGNQGRMFRPRREPKPFVLGEAVLSL